MRICFPSVISFYILVLGLLWICIRCNAYTGSVSACMRIRIQGVKISLIEKTFLTSFPVKCYIYFIVFIDRHRNFWNFFPNTKKIKYFISSFHLFGANFRHFLPPWSWSRRSPIMRIRRCGGLGVVSLPLGRPARVRISARGLLTVWSEGRQITL